jgi:hypothetical protein
MSEVVIAVKEPPKDLKNYDILGIGADVLQVIPIKSKEGFLVKFVDDKGDSSPVYRVRVATKLRKPG